MWALAANDSNTPADGVVGHRTAGNSGVRAHPALRYARDSGRPDKSTAHGASVSSIDEGMPKPVDAPLVTQGFRPSAVPSAIAVSSMV